MKEMWKYGNKYFKCTKVQIGSSSDSWYQSAGLVEISRAAWCPVTLTPGELALMDWHGTENIKVFV